METVNYRAYSLLTVKSVDSERRMIAGVATTPTPDRMGDIVESMGVQFTNPLPLLLYHDSKQPVGLVTFKKATKAGIEFEARIPTIDEPASLKDRVDTAWASVKAGLIKGVSIGFRSLEEAFNKETNGIRFLKTEVVELSLVAVPANQDATIHSIKHFDTPAPAASGTGAAVRSHLPGVSGQRKASSPMNISEQLTTERNTLQIKSARLEELMKDDEQDGGLEADEKTEKDGLIKEIPALTAKVNQLAAVEAAQAAIAGTLSYAPPTTSTRTMAPTRSTPTVEIVPRMKGQAFVRYAMAVAAGKGSASDTLAYAKRFTDTPEVVQYIKAVEGTSVVSSPAWGGELVYPTNLVSEFVELLRPATIVGRIDGFRMTPFNIRVPRQQMGSTVNWVGEAAPKPVSELSFDTITMAYHKVAGIVVLTDELVRLSSPSAEETVRRDLVEQIARFIDAQFVTPSVAAGANNPASITNGVASPAATGADLDSFRLDFYTALGTFDTADVPTDGLVIITTPAIARGISMYLNPLGQTPTGFNVTPTGGTLLGYPVIVSASVPSGTLIIIKPSEILMADDGRVTLDASNQATLDMLGGSPGAPTFNLWQRNCTAIRAERWLTWLPRRDGAVAVIDTASYGPSVGSP